MKRFLISLCVLSVAALTAIGDDWPQFRGPSQQGLSRSEHAPLTWSEKENIAWKIDIPGRGWSSPSIRGQQIWLTTALDDGRALHAIAIHRETGKTLHDVEVFKIENPGKVHAKNSHASPTPLIEGDRVYVHFGAHGTACLSTAGDILWTNRELKYNHVHGPGGSPVIYQNLLIFSCDGSDKQFVVGLDKRTGKVVWKTDRKHISQARLSGESNVPMAYTTPLLVRVGESVQLLSNGADSIVSYDPQSGSELWWYRYDGYSNIPRPVAGKGHVFISSGYDRPEFMAVRLAGQGDVTDTHLAWNLKKGAPLSASPLLVGNQLFLVSDNGIATCLDAISGEQHWQERIGGNFSASPTFASGRVYLLDESGTTTVINAAPRFKVLATNKIDGRTLATPAFVDDVIFLRSEKHLYRIQEN